MMNQQEIEAAGREEYALWRETKDRVNDIKEFMMANVNTHLNRFDDAFKSGDITKTMELFGPGGGIAGMTKGAQKILSQIEFPKNFNIIDYFKPVKDKRQMSAAINALKHQHSTYDKSITGVGRQDYNGVQEGWYGSIKQGLKESKLEQHSKWAEEIYIEKMRGLGTPGF
jgi:hypothetical protein